MSDGQEQLREPEAYANGEIASRTNSCNASSEGAERECCGSELYSVARKNFSDGRNRLRTVAMLRDFRTLQRFTLAYST